MRLTNTLALPEPIVRAVANDGYSRGEADISVTELLAPPRQRALMRAHADALEEDVSDRIWSLLGQSIHEILRRADMEALTEQRLFMSVAGWTVSGAMDRFVFLPTGTCQDYKVTSVWAVRDGGKEEWEQQTNLYAHLIRHHGFVVGRLEVVAFLRDWRRNEALRYGNSYPQHQVAVLPVRLWEPDEAQAYLEERVRLHQEARVILPLCTPDERWQRPTVFAVMKEGRKTAMRLCDTRAEAEALAATEAKCSVVERVGEAIRCAQYCAVAPFCRAVGDAQWANDGTTIVDEPVEIPV